MKFDINQDPRELMYQLWAKEQKELSNLMLFGDRNPKLFVSENKIGKVTCWCGSCVSERSPCDNCIKAMAKANGRRIKNGKR